MTLFFSCGVEKECSFSFYKLTSYPFFTISSPVPIWSTSFFLFIFSISSVHAHSSLFLHFFFCYCLRPIARLCLHVLCLMSIVHYVRVSVPTYMSRLFVYLYLFIPSFFLLMGAVMIGL
jgi:hypothetical protein